MPDKFNVHCPPFNYLDSRQHNLLRSSLDVAYFRENQVVLASNSDGEQLYILIKGVVEERSEDGQQIFAHYANDDLFDIRAIFEGQTRHHYIAIEDTLVYVLPKSIFIQLYNSNGQFAAYFDNNLAKRQQLLDAAQQQQNLAEFILTKVDGDIYHPAMILPGEQTLTEVTYQLKESARDCALVRLSDNGPHLNIEPASLPYGIVTRTNLLHATLLDGLPATTPVSQIATFPVVYIDEGDFLFDAMLKMTRQRIKRVMVVKGKKAIGMLDMTQILSAFSTHSHVLTLAIDRACTIEQLAIASHRQRKLIDRLYNNGIRTRFIMELLAAVNEQIIEKAFELIVPPAWHNQCCLVVLGSEGRGEQIIKTDQDNALIIKDGVDWPQCDAVMAQVTETLQQLGYPLCSGQVMVNNPNWVKSASDWQRALSLWSKATSPKQMMDLAIFADAHPVAGNKQLLNPVKEHLATLMQNNMLALQTFCRPVLQFSLPLTLFGRVKKDKQGIDLKSGAIFPIVHGIRTLALEYGITDSNTFTRIETLKNKRILEPDTADNLNEAFKLFFKLRLGQQLSNQHNGNQLDITQLERTERDLLRHALHAVKKFKQFLGYHYQIRD